MKIIRNNPYRAIGVLVGTSPRKVLSQLNTLKIYLSANEKIPEEELPYGFEILSKLTRNLDLINDANARLNMAEEKLLNGIFWFYDGGKVGDKEAFDALNEGDIETAVEIWEAIIGGNDIDASNASAFHNLSLLKLNIAFKSNRVFVKVLEEGLLMQLKFISSKYSDTFFSECLDSNGTGDKAKYELVFLNAIQEELSGYANIASGKLLEIVSKVEFSAKEEFLQASGKKLIGLIEALISNAEQNRIENPKEASVFGTELYEKSKTILANLKNTIGKSNIRFISISDQLAEEILQCGLDFFNALKEDDFDPGELTLKQFENAKEIAKGDLIKRRIQENLEGLQVWLDNANERATYNLIREDFDFIKDKLESLNGRPEAVEIANQLVNQCWPVLKKIRGKIGLNSEPYLKISGAVANRAQSILIKSVNKEMERSSHLLSYGVGSSSLIRAVEGALEVSFKLGSFGMESEQRDHYEKNFAALKRLARQINVSTVHPKEKFQNQLEDAESRLRGMANYIPLADRIVSAQNELDLIKEWHFLRSQATREREIAQQEKVIRALQERSNNEKAETIKRIEEEIVTLKKKIKLIDY